MLKRYIWILLSWMTHTDYTSIWWSAGPAGGKPEAWAQGHKTPTRDYWLLMSLRSPQTAFLCKFPPPTLMIQQVKLIVIPNLFCFWMCCQSNNLGIEKRKKLWLTCFNSRVTYSYRKWQEVGARVRGCWVSCMLGKHGLWCTFSAITPSFHLLITSFVLFMLSQKKWDICTMALREMAPVKKERGLNSVREKQ